MFKKHLQRCIASLLVIILCSGTFCPTTVFAVSDDHKAVPARESFAVTSNVNAQSYTVYFYYPDKPTATNPNGINGTKNLFKLSQKDGVNETFGWADKTQVDNAGVFTLNPDWRKLEDGSNETFTNKVLHVIDSNLGSGIDSEEALFKALDDLGNSQGASSARLSNLNQRMAALLYVRLNPEILLNGNKYVWESVESIDIPSYANILNSTLEQGHETSIHTMLTDMQLITAATDSSVEETGKAFSYSYEYSVIKAGILGMDTTLPNSVNISNHAYSEGNLVFLANEMAIYNCLAEYLNWYLVEMPKAVKVANWQADDKIVSSLTYLRIFNEAFGDFIPFITAAYEKSNPDADDLSIKDMVEQAGANNLGIEDVLDVDTSEYKEHVDTTSPITQFYTINSKTGITGYDRNTLLADVEVDKRYDEETENNIEQAEYENATNGENNYEIPNTFLTTQSSVAKSLIDSQSLASKEYNSNKVKQTSAFNKAVKNGLYKTLKSGEADTIIDVLSSYYGDSWADNVEKALDAVNYLDLYNMFNENVLNKLEIISKGNTDDIEKHLNDTAKESNTSLESIVEDAVDFGVDEKGTANSMGSVTINSLILTGMSYSAEFIPMRTNLYSQDTLAKFKESDNKDFYNFYIDYGFMRKALYMDTSSSAAVDFYNANGKTTGNLRVCTLRDMLEVGKNDLALYIDSNFYNAKTAIEEGNVLLDKTHKTKEGIYNSLIEFSAIWKNSSVLTNNVRVALDTVDSTEVRTALLELIEVDENAEADERYKVNVDDLKNEFSGTMLDSYKFNISKFDTSEDMKEYADELSYANSVSEANEFSEQTLKTGDYTSYDNARRSLLADVANSDYVNLSGDSKSKGVAGNWFNIDLTDRTINTDDNLDTLVLTSSQINQYLSGEITYSQTLTSEDEKSETINSYTTDTGYNPLMSLAYVSCLYRDSGAYTLAGCVQENNPVFLASDDLCGIDDANQWYRNTLLNYILLSNLKGNAQVDIDYVTDLDCPVYMDVFGNILTESGVVVIPAASNATLHAGSFKNYNYSAGLYSAYGKDYMVSQDLKGAQSVLYPYFVIDSNIKEYIVSGISMSVNNKAVRFDKMDTNSPDTQKALREAYLAAVSSGDTTRINWVAMVNIINEVMRGAPIEAIDKEAEGLFVNQTKSGLLAAAKLESMLKSLRGKTSNTLLYIPDFSRTDNLEVWVALFIKLLMVATAAVIIIAIYRDGVAGNLGIRTFITSLSAIALTASCVVVIPSVFQLTYYSANKFLLEDESMRILMVNEEKRQGGAEIGITEVNTVDSTGEFALQLDWINVPWYEELETILYESSLDNLQKTKLEAYRNSAIYNNTDVSMYNDGAYITTDSLFDSVSIDFTFNATGSYRGLILYQNDSQQTAGFYSPYYVFLRSLVANVNEYNAWLNTSGDNYTNEESAQDALESGAVPVIGSYNYTTKYMSGNRLKTVGLCKAYFESKNFMEYDEDLLRLHQIYGNSASTENPAVAAIGERDASFNRAVVFQPGDKSSFENTYWYNENLVHCDMDYYNTVSPFDKHSKKERQNNYVQKVLESYYSKVDAMDAYARDFIVANRDMLDKVSDETFIKVMALNLAIKYNQLFGVTSANALEIFNMDSEDLIRLCVVPTNEAVMATAMSYPRFIYTFGGEAGVYVAAALSVILWLGSFIKPLCTVVVFISVFMSIFVFRVVLRKPSANLWGYLVTVFLLCCTNLLHSVVLKIGVNLPNFGLSTLGCLIFLIVGQVVYLLILAYVTGVSLKDWSNLGASEYEKEARLLQSKFKAEDTSAKLSGRVPHYENNWDYYNALVKQHRSRNAN